MSLLLKRLEQIVSIPSKTFCEQKLVQFLKEWFLETKAKGVMLESEDCLIFQSLQNSSKPHLALVGHLDVVPTYFPPYIKGDFFYGAGASDMKAALACYLAFFEQYLQNPEQSPYQISLIFYSREEGTPLIQNGLYHLVQKFPDYFKSIDLAIVGEPTNNTVQIGCVGSIHLEIEIKGKACHSARVWEGKNALYEALPFLNKIAQLEPVRHQVFGVDFFDVLHVTESASEKGRTSLPGWWKGNVNFRFAPVYQLDEAKKHCYQLLKEAGLAETQIRWIDGVEAGIVIENDIFCEFVEKLDTTIQAKQAWTDVAQLTGLGIAAFNYGPGLTSQAHKENEYCCISEVKKYLQSLETSLFHPRDLSYQSFSVT